MSKWQVEIHINNHITIKATELESMEQANNIAKHYMGKISKTTKQATNGAKSKPWGTYENYNKYQPDLASDKQKAFLNKNNIVFNHKLTKSEATDLIKARIAETQARKY